MTSIIFIIWLALIVACYYFGMYRNRQVYHFRMDYLKRTSMAARIDINEHLRPWMWRYEKLDEPEYVSMVLQFWKPLESFYPDKSFLDPNSSGPAS